MDQIGLYFPLSQLEFIRLTSAEGRGKEWHSADKSVLWTSSSSRVRILRKQFPDSKIFILSDSGQHQVLTVGQKLRIVTINSNYLEFDDCCQDLTIKWDKLWDSTLSWLTKEGSGNIDPLDLIMLSCLNKWRAWGWNSCINWMSSVIDEAGGTPREPSSTTDHRRLLGKWQAGFDFLSARLATTGMSHMCDYLICNYSGTYPLGDEAESAIQLAIGMVEPQEHWRVLDWDLQQPTFLAMMANWSVSDLAARCDRICLSIRCWSAIKRIGLVTVANKNQTLHFDQSHLTFYWRPKNWELVTATFARSSEWLMLVVDQQLLSAAGRQALAEKFELIAIVELHPDTMRREANNHAQIPLAIVLARRIGEDHVGPNISRCWLARYLDDGFRAQANQRVEISAGKARVKFANLFAARTTQAGISCIIDIKARIADTQSWAWADNQALQTEKVDWDAYRLKKLEYKYLQSCREKQPVPSSWTFDSQYIRLDELFELVSPIPLNQSYAARYPGSVPLLGSTDQNGGIIGYCDKCTWDSGRKNQPGDRAAHLISLVYNGELTGTCFVQTGQLATTRQVVLLVPHLELGSPGSILNADRLIYICCALTKLGQNRTNWPISQLRLTMISMPKLWFGKNP